jgi:hypothetical protein
MYSRLNQHLITNNVLATEQFGFRKNRSTEHAAYTLVNGIFQAWNSKLQVAGIFCDLAKAFDSVNHDILIQKLKYYGVNETGINWFKSYLYNRKQRVNINVNNLHNYSLTWETVKRGVPQGSVLGPLLFVTYVNDLSRHINRFANVILFADDTSILITEKYYDDLNQTIKLALECSNRWFKANQLVLNLMKTNIIKFSPSHFPQPQLITNYNNTTISEVPNTKFLGVQIDNHLNWKCHIDQILPKLSTASFVIRQLFYILDSETLRIAYFSYFHSIVRYGIIFWGNAADSCKVFRLQKRVISIMSGARPRASCIGPFKKLEILPVPCQYILSVMLFIIDNSNQFLTSSEVHGLHTRSKNHLFIPATNLTSIQKGITYSGIKMYNRLPNNILNHRNDRKKFKNKLYKYLLNNLFYSVKEFMKFSREN